MVRQLRSVLGPPQERREAIVQARLEFRKAEMLEFLADAAMEPQESTEEQVAQEKAYRTEILTAYDRRNSVESVLISFSFNASAASVASIILSR